MTDVTRSELTDASSDQPGREAVAVAVGTAVGATARWVIGELADLDPTSGEFPWATLVVNVIGCLLIGVVAARLTGLARVGIATGVLGGFTTVSAFAVEANELADAGERLLAAAYVVASMALGVGAAWLGRRFAARRTGAAS